MSILNEPVLTLNRNWQPITFLPVQTAIVTVMRDMASIMCPRSFYLLSWDEWLEREVDSDRLIKTPTRGIMAPEVIVLKRYGERPPRKISLTRLNLWRRDEWSCQYCGKELPGRKLQLEHVIPRSRGGRTTWDNCVAACAACNARKADRTPKEANMRLRKEPREPSWKPGMRLPERVFDSWEPFISKEAS